MAFKRYVHQTHLDRLACVEEAGTQQLSLGIREEPNLCPHDLHVQKDGDEAARGAGALRKSDQKNRSHYKD